MTKQCSDSPASRSGGRAVNLVGASFGFVDLVRPKEDEIEFVVGTGWYRKNLGLRAKRGEVLSGTE